VDLSVIFYDVTAFVTHGQHADSKLMDFGFAHNTPSNKRKLKLALNAAKGATWRNCHVANAPVARRHALLSRFDRKAPVCHPVGG
ncbi:MAG: hypothetical protein ACKO9F_09310, partial [Caldilinea sp.]